MQSGSARLPPHFHHANAGYYPARAERATRRVSCGGVERDILLPHRHHRRAGELEDVFVEVDLTPPANGGSGRGGGVIDLGAGGGGPSGPVVINLERLMSGRRDVRTMRVRRL
jgi:hypothetical protein